MKKIKILSKRIKLNPKRIKRTIFIKPKYTNKAILFLFLTILGFLISTNVNAGTQDSTLVRKEVEGIYAIAPLKDKTHLYNLEIYMINNRIGYCVEIGKKITTNTYNSTKDITEQKRVTNLNENQLEYIKLISYFGYGYSGHNDNKYYMAAQELIWEYINNIDISWTATPDINGDKINIETQKNNIKQLINEYTSNYSFSSTIDTKVGEKITLQDTNNALKFYKILNSSSQKANISSNTLTINISNNYIGKDYITLQRINNYNDTPNIYYFNDSQALISVGNIKDLQKKITLNIKGETLTTNLIDVDTKTNIPSGQATLTGAVYELYDKNNKLVTTFTTDETTINTIPNLYHDTYYIKQIKPSKGYKLNSQIYKIDLTSENNHLILTEEVIKSTVEINKLYELDDGYKREPNIKFNIYDNKDKLYTSLTTTEYGTNKVTLPYGIYTVKQENTTYGYDKIKNIQIIIDENTNPTIRYDLIDKKILNKLHITTKDNTNNLNIKEKNIKYKLKNKDTNKYIYYINANNKKITQFSTNSNGELTIPTQLPYGEYILEQVSPPKQYLENKEKIPISINEKSEYSYINDEVVINIDFFNEPIIGKLNILTNKETYMTENNHPIKKTEIRKNIEVELYKNKKLINTYQTDEEGKLKIESLPLDNYCIKEKNSSNQKCVELINKDNKTKIIEKTIVLTEIIKMSNVTLKNIDELNDPIEGTTVELYKDDQLVNENITDENGHIKVDNLSQGKYCFKETKVSDKYILNEEKLCFNVGNDGKDINVTLINKLKQNKIIPIPDTLSNKEKYIIFPLSILIFTLGVIIYKKKIHNPNN